MVSNVMPMNRKQMKVMVVFAITIMLGATFSGCMDNAGVKEVKGFDMDDIENIDVERKQGSTPVVAAEHTPFYALIGTPIAAYYEGNESMISPLLVKNFTEPSKPVMRFDSQYAYSGEMAITDGTPKNVSLELVPQIWKESDAVVLIEDSEPGYYLGVAATPIASYLNIPVIVTDDTDDVRDLLDDLGVKYTFLCGDLEGHERTWRFTSDQDITNFLVDYVKERFGSVEYLSITNPRDAYPPEVLNTTSFEFSGTLNSVAILPSTLLSTAQGFLSPAYHNFTIPEGWKYARVKLDLINLNSENVESMGDQIMISGGPRIEDLPASQQMYELVQINTMAGIPERDADGDIVTDKVHYETVLYGRDGVTYDLSVIGTWLARKQGEYRLEVTVEQLSDPYISTMPKLSAIAPYLTAYRQGVIWAEPDFAFAATDDVLVNGDTCPGFYVPRKNPKLAEPLNEKIMERHEELNLLLGNISNISGDDTEALWQHYSDNPINIALVGGTTMLPQYIHDNPDTPRDDPMGIYYFGYGTPSDVPYGNIDPNPTDIKNDTYSYWPRQENVVGRITGWDVQDASALVCRTVFYEQIIQDMGDWKNRATVQSGTGTDFQKVPVIEQIKNLLAPILGGAAGDPMKFPSGATRFAGDAVAASIEDGGYEVERTYFTFSQRKGFSDEALQEIKRSGLLNMLLFPKFEIKMVSGEDVVVGGELQLKSNIIYENGHGSMHLYEFGDVVMWGLGIGYFFGPLIMGFLTRISMFATPMAALGTYSARGVEDMELGPSTMMIESCVNGKIDGMYMPNNIGQAYIHAGVNSLLASTTFTNVAGYLKPRPFIHSLGVYAYVKAWYDLLVNGEYPRLNFGMLMHKQMFNDMAENDTTIGMALRNARNDYLPKDANSTFLWVPPLDGEASPTYQGDTGILKPDERGDRVLLKKYNTYLQYAIYGDPAFNPYQPVNNG